MIGRRKIQAHRLGYNNVALSLVGLLGMALLLPETWLRTGTLVWIAAIGALGLNVLMGLAHQFSVGHAAFIAIGAYGTGFAMSSLQFPYPIAALVGVVSAGALGAAFSPIAFKLRHLGLALMTFGLIYAVQHVLRNVEALGGALRPMRVPDIEILGWSLAEELSLFGVIFSRNAQYFLFTGIVTVLAAVITHQLINSRRGRVWSLMGRPETELVAAHVGESVRGSKVTAFVFASALAGLSGALIAPHARILQYGDFDLTLSVEYIAMIVIGGTGTVAGSIYGALFVVGLRDVIRAVAPFVPFVAEEGSTTGLTIAQASTLVYGAMIMLLLIFYPGGIEGLVKALRRWLSPRLSHQSSDMPG